VTRAIRCGFVVLFVAVLTGGLASGAGAQVPPVPPVPEPPPEVTDALTQAQEAAFPVLVQVATGAQPVMTAGGPAVRPVCGSPLASLVLVLAVGNVPLQPGFVGGPLNLMCAGAWGVSPADGVLGTVDRAAGQDVEDAVDPVLGQVQSALAPAHPNLGQACWAWLVAVPPYYLMPPPISRFDAGRVVCAP
jgi:hypothetical protein